MPCQVVTAVTEAIERSGDSDFWRVYLKSLPVRKAFYHPSLKDYTNFWDADVFTRNKQQLRRLVSLDTARTFISKN